MKILAIDTASEICSVAVLENNTVLKEVSINDGMTHSQKLMPIVQDILDELHLSIYDFDLFACDKGPGSFTGIRIGVSTITAFCDVTHIPSIGISSLEALAYNIHDYSGHLCSIIDAKNDNVYCGIFKIEDGIVIQIHEYFFDNIKNVLEILPKVADTIFFVGNASIIYKDLIKFNLKINSVFSDESFNNLLSSSVAKAALSHYTSNLSNDINDISPLYLKKSNAEISLEKKQEDI